MTVNGEKHLADKKATIEEFKIGERPEATVDLTPGGDSADYLKELRLQNPEVIHAPTLQQLARRSRKPKLIRTAERIAALLSAEEGELL